MSQRKPSLGGWKQTYCHYTSPSGRLLVTYRIATGPDGNVFPASQKFLCQSEDGLVHLAVTGGTNLWFACSEPYSFAGKRVAPPGSHVTCLSCCAEGAVFG